MDYKFGDVLEHAKITRSELTYWTKSGLVESATPRQGPGHHRLFTFFNVFEAAVAGRTHGAGVPTEHVRTIIGHLRQLEKELDRGLTRAALMKGLQRAFLGRLKGVPKEGRKAHVRRIAEKIATGRLKDLSIWREVRSASTRSEEDPFYGVVYQPRDPDATDDPDSPDFLPPFGQVYFVARHSGETFTMQRTGIVQIHVDIGGILLRLERATRDNLDKADDITKTVKSSTKGRSRKDKNG